MNIIIMFNIIDINIIIIIMFNIIIILFNIIDISKGVMRRDMIYIEFFIMSI